MQIVGDRTRRWYCCAPTPRETALAANSRSLAVERAGTARPLRGKYPARWQRCAPRRRAWRMPGDSSWRQWSSNCRGLTRRAAIRGRRRGDWRRRALRGRTRHSQQVPCATASRRRRGEHVADVVADAVDLAPLTSAKLRLGCNRPWRTMLSKLSTCRNPTVRRARRSKSIRHVERLRRAPPRPAPRSRGRNIMPIFDRRILAARRKYRCSGAADRGLPAAHPRLDPGGITKALNSQGDSTASVTSPANNAAVLRNSASAARK